LKYVRSTALDGRDIRIRTSEFVAKTQFLCIGDRTAEMFSAYSLTITSKRVTFINKVESTEKAGLNSLIHLNFFSAKNNYTI